MRTIIVGCGRVGAGLAGRLADAGDEVTIIDVKTDAFDRLPEGFAGNAVRADGTDEDVLRRIGIEGSDRFFALTEGDNRNILAAQLAAETFSVPMVVAKVNDPVRAEAYAAMGIAIICRTDMMVESMAGFVGLPMDNGAMRVMPPTGHHAHADETAKEQA
ncbi:MAG: TrkA family potassium uptake protein [Candidatus Limnocylindrales bacterium]